MNEKRAIKLIRRYDRIGRMKRKDMSVPINAILGLLVRSQDAEAMDAEQVNLSRERMERFISNEIASGHLDVEADQLAARRLL